MTSKDGDQTTLTVPICCHALGAINYVIAIAELLDTRCRVAVNLDVLRCKDRGTNKKDNC
eukprot:9270816-Karenia_brevis.AAC.1